MTEVPDHVRPERNGSLKVKPLTGDGAIRLHFIALFHGVAAWTRTRFILAWGTEINLRVHMTPEESNGTAVPRETQIHVV